MILIDTTPLVALCDPRDSLNKTALKHLQALTRSGIAVCEPVLTEVCFHLPALSQRQRLQQILERLHIQPVTIEDTHAFWRDVFDWLATYADHDPDWADGYLAVLCSRDKKYKVWTYDREFSTIWRKSNGSPIPLAVRAKIRHD